MTRTVQRLCPRVPYRPLLAGMSFLLLTGCGNQMLRQESHGPLSSPRAVPPVDAIPTSTPAWDAAPSTSAAFGSTGPRLPEPALPPPNLSDIARNQPSPPAVDKMKNPLAGNTEAVEVGRTVFLTRCTQCHDVQGHGHGPVGQYLVPGPVDLTSSIAQRRTDGALFWHITMGQGKMPPFRTWTSTYQRWALVDYVRALKMSKGTSTSTYPRFGEPNFERKWRGASDVQ